MAEDDPHLWLEDVTGDEQLAWARGHNAETDAELGATPGFVELEARLKAVLDSDDKLPIVEKIGEYYYNFWQDAQHERGIWRRTTFDEFRSPAPTWETVLDLDALNEAEGENWVWHGAEALPPAYQRALIALSRGGADADVTREFDLGSLDWVPDGFFRPEAKGELRWIDEDTVYLTTDVGEGSMTTSGYPRTVHELRRGQALDEATLIYEGRDDDMVVSAEHDHTVGYERDFVTRRMAFYADELYVRTAEGLARLGVPDSAGKLVHRRWLTARLREAAIVEDDEVPAGSLVVYDYDEYGRLDRVFVFTPNETSTIESYCWTRDHLVITLLDNVQPRIKMFKFGDDPGSKADVQPTELTDLPDLVTASVWPVDSRESNDLWLTTTGYLSPPTLSRVELDDDGSVVRVEELKAASAHFDSSNHVVEQHTATSRDGTQVPYFVIRPNDLAFDGQAPTILYGYGGFEISMTPTYSGVIGRAWLERGGVYAVANIRGGGEFGPRWHQAAFKQNRHLAYQDFAAVAEDLATRRITSPSRLGVEGGSNGGLLTGNMLTSYTELFGAILIAVPLLDMKRYSHLLAGASWMAEYGNPDTDEWNFIKTFSPYHLFDPDKAYPPTFIWTTTRDDRVHPGHARKMAAKMFEAGKDVRYFENVEGGHGTGSTSAQTAHVEALTYAFFAKVLGLTT